MTSLGKLVVCPTPLGNLGDMTRRALDALRGADVVYAEDTRVTGRLLAAFGIEKRLERLDEALMAERSATIVRRVLEGQVAVYCSDAGMPGVSDPGLRLVRDARAAGVTVEVLPGPTAVATAYVASGCANPRFFFGGFLPRKQQQRCVLLESLRTLDAALIFYESPNRLVSSLEAVAEAFPRREVAVCRELTKLHEEILRTTLAEAVAYYETQPPRGEYVLIVEGAKEAAQSEVTEEDAVAHVQALLSQGYSKKDAVRQAAAETGFPKNALYDAVMKA